MVTTVYLELVLKFVDSTAVKTVLHYLLKNIVVFIDKKIT